MNYLENGKTLSVHPLQVKVGDTGTKVSFSLDPKADFQNVQIKIKNNSGYIVSINTDGKSFSTDELKSLPPDIYYLEAWATCADGQPVIYPDKGFVAMTINKNALAEDGTTIAYMTLDEFKQQIADGISSLKSQVIQGAKGDQGPKGDPGPKGDKGDSGDSQILLVSDEAAAKKASAADPTALYVWSE